MTRKEELLKTVNNKPTLAGLIDEIVYMEGEMERLRKLPMLKVDKDEPSYQKATPASKMYQELRHQYIAAVKTIEIALGAEETESESPLRAWLKKNGADE